MTTINSVGNILAGVTGTGNFVGANTPTLITPVLGAATATSINFGGSSLANYVATTPFTPTVTFGTPGDLTVAYSINSAFYIQIGSLVYFSMVLRFTPTYTTASGNIIFSGLVITPSATVTNIWDAVITDGATWPVGCTQIYANQISTSSNIQLVGIGSATNGSNFTTTNFPTSVQHTVIISGGYSV